MKNQPFTTFKKIKTLKMEQIEEVDRNCASLPSLSGLMMIALF
jgi:hypothetical protein